jgi:parvulin-like peptidyl-prolyl isomerase
VGGGGEERTEAKRREKMKKYVFVRFLPMILFFLWGCSGWERGLPEDILAEVNREQITVDQFDREFRELILEPGREGNKDLKELKQAYLDQMIERKILVQEARRLGIGVSQEELNQAIFEIRRDYPGEGFGEKLVLKGVTFEKWKVHLEEKLLAEKMMRNTLRYQGKIDEREALQYYETHVSSFQLSQKVRVRQIFVTDGEEAIQILKRLKKGENFEKVAMEKSLGPEKVNGGDLGYFSQGERPAEFDRVFAMEVGTVSEVIKSLYGYHIFKLEEKIPARQIPFEEAKSAILNELGQKKAEEEYERRLKGLRGKAIVKINKKWLKS